MQNQNVKKHLQIIFQDASKIILQLRSSKIGQDFLPIRRVLQIDCSNKSTRIKKQLMKQSLRELHWNDPSLALISQPEL